jgi:hypothetical protein
MLSDVKTALEKRSTDVETVIAPFNKAQDGILKIVYTQDNIAHEPNIGEWVWGAGFDRKQRYTAGGIRYNITYEGIEQYLLSIYSKVGIFEFLDLALRKDVIKTQSYENILNYCDEMTVKLIEQGVSAIESNNIQSIVNDLFSKLINKSNLHSILSYLGRCYSNNHGYPTHRSRLFFALHLIDECNGFSVIIKVIRSIILTISAAYSSMTR